MEYNSQLDCTGLYCPLPIIKTKLELEDMKEGEVLKVISDDPGAKADFPAWCDQTGNILLNSEEISGEYIFYIKKKK